MEDKRGLRVAILALIIASLLLGCRAQAAEPVRIADTGYDAVWVENAIVAFILEHGYQQPVKLVRVTADGAQTQLTKGGIDVMTEGWEANWRATYSTALQSNTIQNLGAAAGMYQQVWYVPKSVADAHSIRTIDDLRRWAKEESADGAKPLTFWNCPESWPCNKLNIIKLEGYGLTAYLTPVNPKDGASLQLTMADASRHGKPVVGYGWSPSAVMGNYDWQVIDEPAFSRACGQKIVSAYNNPLQRPLTEACAYEPVPLSMLARTDLRARVDGDTWRFLSSVRFGAELQATLAYALESGVVDQEGAKLAAVWYMRQYPAKWKAWLNGDEKRIQRVEAALR